MSGRSNVLDFSERQELVAHWRAMEAVTCGIFWALIVGWLLILVMCLYMPSRDGFRLVGASFLIALAVRAIQHFYERRLKDGAR